MVATIISLSFPSYGGKKSYSVLYLIQERGTSRYCTMENTSVAALTRWKCLILRWFESTDWMEVLLERPSRSMVSRLCCVVCLAGCLGSCFCSCFTLRAEYGCLNLGVENFHSEHFVCVCMRVCASVIAMKGYVQRIYQMLLWFVSLWIYHLKSSQATVFHALLYCIGILYLIS